jgi:hypothetical protein
MAKLQLNSALRDLRGSIDNLVIRRTPYGKVLSRKPDMSRVKWSAAQLAHRQRMKVAASKYRKLMSDPVQAERLKARAAKRGVPVSSLVMGPLLRAPAPEAKPAGRPLTRR